MELQLAARTRPAGGKPAPLSALVSQQMKAMPRQDTRLEVALRREMHRRGLRFRIHLRELPGTPDVALTKARVAVFVDGCFWHRCPEHGTAPKNNAEWWAHKLEANVERDRRNNRRLRDLGWIPVRVWEHEDLVDAAEKIHLLWCMRTNRTAGQT